MNNTADQIKGAVRRMQGVLIKVNGEESLSIDARALDGMGDEGVFDVEGEHAANLISEARAYRDIADEGVMFDDALAFVVEGYLSNYREANVSHAIDATVRQAIDIEFWDAFKVEGSHMATIG